MKPRLPAQAATAWGLVLATILLGWFGRDLAKALDARWLIKWPLRMGDPVQNPYLRRHDLAGRRCGP
ncbi:hypothetical protein [Leisingera sp. M658]|uniref:hypothetical protein n=1 Tax=Leisingera sp. M658 TaxID=2867015 RepID=UPI0021A2C9C4|nr:hypothetical protein [Leisingera sp. M658]UWQ75866.1 hypothetical protein K3724_05305 [Leisingera sp. M658]